MNELPSRPLPELFFRTRSQYDILLSPHFDDVCFSLGAIISKCGGGKLLTVFSQSNYLENPEIRYIIKGERSPETPPERAFVTKVVSRLRLVEESKFCRMADLKLFLGDLLDAPLRGRHPFKYTARFAALDTPALSEIILNRIRRLSGILPERGKPWLICPMAIGNHIDHLIVLNTVIQNLQEIRTQYRLAFYEDLPYSSNISARKEGLQSFFDLLVPNLMTRYFHPVENAQHKISLINIYQSQLPAYAHGLERFSPNLGIPGTSHEALWIYNDDISATANV